MQKEKWAIMAAWYRVVSENHPTEFAQEVISQFCLVSAYLGFIAEPDLEVVAEYSRLSTSLKMHYWILAAIAELSAEGKPVKNSQVGDLLGLHKNTVFLATQWMRYRKRLVKIRHNKHGNFYEPIDLSTIPNFIVQIVHELVSVDDDQIKRLRQIGIKILWSHDYGAIVTYTRKP